MIRIELDFGVYASSGFVAIFMWINEELVTDQRLLVRGATLIEFIKRIDPDEIEVDAEAADSYFVEQLKRYDIPNVVKFN